VAQFRGNKSNASFSNILPHYFSGLKLGCGGLAIFLYMNPASPNLSEKFPKAAIMGLKQVQVSSICKIIRPNFSGPLEIKSF
jgi:hypothetical protein